MHKVKLMDTTLRDAHQSLWATRMTTDDMLPILEKLDEAGYYALEVWGGATFDVCIRYLNEDPWERLRAIRERVKKTKLQMLLRGQSLVGYSHYPDDAVVKFIQKSADNGIDIFRIFDALNDIRNMEKAIQTVRETGKHAQAAIAYTVSPVHSIEYYVEFAKRLEDTGADSICIKDMAGLLLPFDAYELVKRLKEEISLPIDLHTHYIGGVGTVSYLKAVEAGVDILDTATVPLSFGASQPPVETVVRALQGTPYDTGIQLSDLFEIANYFDQLRKERGFERGITRISDMKVFEHQVPGGMISNLVSQLEEQRALNRMGEVLEEIPRVREDFGYPPLVTPTSQIVGTQAVLNVLTGERYKMCPGEVKDYVRGLYGKPPVEISEDVRKKIIGDAEVIQCRPADLLEPIWEKAKAEMATISDKDEDILTYIMFPQVALKFFANRKREQAGASTEAATRSVGTDAGIRPVPSLPKKKAVQPPVVRPSKPIREEEEEMNIDEIRQLVGILEGSSISDLEIEKDHFRLSLRKNPNEGTPPSARPKLAPVKEEEAEIPEGMIPVSSPMVGTFYSAPSPEAPPYVKVGDHVKYGQVLCIVEAMKLMNEIKSEVNGTIEEILVTNGQAVEYDQLLFLIKED